MAEPEQFDVVVIGSGYAGKWVAWDLAASGQRTVAVERRYIGGSCPNINCLPSKNEIASAKVADVVRHAADFGTEVSGMRVDMPPVLARKRRMVEAEVDFHRQKYRETGCELIMGEARFVGPPLVHADQPFLLPRSLVVSSSTYDRTTGAVASLMVGTPLANSAKATASAINGNNYVTVWDNESVDSSFGVTSSIQLIDMEPNSGHVFGTIAVPPDQVVTSFPSKSELGLHVSDDGSRLSRRRSLSAREISRTRRRRRKTGSAGD
jgi:hypothetical protein